MRFGVLGALEVVGDDGATVDVGGRQPRLVLAMLLVAEARIVAPDAIAEELWGEGRPASAAGTLQSYVSRLRGKLGGGRLVWEEPGYRLAVEDDEVDAFRFEALAEQGRALAAEGRLEEAREALVAADALWRGPALLEFRDRDFATGPATRLDEGRLAALEARIDADLALGRHAAAAGELAELVRRHPLREGLRGQLALALYRSGRQAEALRAIDDARRTLRDELGVDLSRQLQELEAAILDHDPALELAGGPKMAVTATAPVLQPTVPAARRGELVGRDAELTLLLRTLEEAAREARFVVIEGEPGIGKTRLAEELAAEAEAGGASVVWGRAFEGGAAPALWPWLAPLRVLAERRGTNDAALDPLFDSDAALSPGAAPGGQFELFQSVATLLEQAAADGPVVVLLDDIQWADEASLDLLTFLSSHAPAGLLVIATMRRLDLGRNDALTEALAAVARRQGSRRVQLRGLAEADTAALLDALTGDPLSREAAAAVHARSEGNPFFATELTRLVLDEGGGDPDAVARVHIPAGVADVVRARLAQLPDDTRDLLSIAAVVGRDVDLSLLHRIADAPPDQVVDHLEPALVHRLLLDVPDQPSAFRFSHALVREVLADDLSSLRRARLHLRVADAIEAAGATDDDVELLAEHLWRAVPVGVGQRAAEALERAADVAIRRVAFASAEDLLRRAVELRRATSASPDDHEAELLAIHRMLVVARARRYFAGAASPDVIARAKELAERTGRKDVLADVLWVEWSAATTGSRIDDAVALVGPFVEVLEAIGDPELDLFAQVVRAIMEWQTGDITSATRRLDEVAARRSSRDGHDFTLEFADERALLGVLFRALMHTLEGTALDGLEPWAVLEALAEGQRDRFVLTELSGFLAVAAEITGDWARCESIGRRVLAVDPDAEFSFYSPMALMALGIGQTAAGDVAEGRRRFADARARYVGVGGGSGLAFQDASLAIALVAGGAADEAVEAVETARRTLQALDEAWNEPIVLIAEAVVARASGDVDVAADRLTAAVEVAASQGSGALVRRAEATAAELGITLRRAG